ncbi:hypothetical protein GCM10027053_52060 [Intrasporangium mesophilum]
MSLDQSFAQAIQNHIHGGSSLTAPTGHKVLLMTANGTSTSGGTELSTGGGYTAGTGQSITWASATAATPSVSANSGSISFTNMPAATIVGIEIKSGSNVRLEFGALTASKTTASGDTLSFAASAISSALS